MAYPLFARSFYMPTFIYIAVIIYTTYLLHNIFFFPKFHWLVIDSGPCWWSLWEFRIFLFLLLFILRLFVILFSFVFPRFFYSRTFQFISPIIPFLVSSRLFGPVSCVFFFLLWLLLLTWWDCVFSISDPDNIGTIAWSKKKIIIWSGTVGF